MQLLSGHPRDRGVRAPDRRDLLNLLHQRGGARARERRPQRGLEVADGGRGVAHAQLGGGEVAEGASARPVLRIHTRLATADLAAHVEGRHVIVAPLEAHRVVSREHARPPELRRLAQRNAAAHEREGGAPTPQVVRGRRRRRVGVADEQPVPYLDSAHDRHLEPDEIAKSHHAIVRSLEVEHRAIAIEDHDRQRFRALVAQLELPTRIERVRLVGHGGRHLVGQHLVGALVARPHRAHEPHLPGERAAQGEARRRGRRALATVAELVRGVHATHPAREPGPRLRLHGEHRRRHVGHIAALAAGGLAVHREVRRHRRRMLQVQALGEEPAPILLAAVAAAHLDIRRETASRPPPQGVQRRTRHRREVERPHAVHEALSLHRGRQFGALPREAEHLERFVAPDWYLLQRGTPGVGEVARVPLEAERERRHPDAERPSARSVAGAGARAKRVARRARRRAVAVHAERDGGRRQQVRAIVHPERAQLVQ